MNSKRSRNAGKIKTFGLAACAVMALGVMTSGETLAQCRLGTNNTGYGYNNGYAAGYGGYGSHYNNRGNVGYDNGYGLTSGYPGYSNQRSSLSLGLSYNRHPNDGYNSGYRNSGYYGSGYGTSGHASYGTAGYNTGVYGTPRSGYGSGSCAYSNARQPVAYRHGNHIDVEDGNGRLHLTGRGY